MWLLAGTKLIWYDHYLTVCVYCIFHVQEFIVVQCTLWALDSPYCEVSIVTSPWYNLIEIKIPH